MAGKYRSIDHKFVEYVDYTPEQIMQLLKQENLERTDLIDIIKELCQRDMDMHKENASTLLEGRCP